MLEGDTNETLHKMAVRTGADSLDLLGNYGWLTNSVSK